tara:strand:- start:1160 stop:1639 length:480 start_codon:yes stop_codon:yes gene_type:complete
MKYNIEYNKDTLILITGIISYIILIIELFKKNYKIVFFYFLLFGLFFLVFHNYAFILAFLFLIIIIILNYLTIKEYNDYDAAKDSGDGIDDELNDKIDEDEENDNQCEIDITRRVADKLNSEADTSKQDKLAEEIEGVLAASFNAIQQQDSGKITSISL